MNALQVIRRSNPNLSHSSDGFLSRVGGFVSAGWRVVADSGTVLYLLITSLAVGVLHIFLPESAVSKITGAFGYVLAFFEKMRGRMTELRCSRTISELTESLNEAHATIERLQWELETGATLWKQQNAQSIELSKCNRLLHSEVEELRSSSKLREAASRNEPRILNVTVSFPTSVPSSHETLCKLIQLVNNLENHLNTIPKEDRLKHVSEYAIVRTARQLLQELGASVATHSK